MEVTYTTTVDDYVAWCMHNRKRSPTQKWLYRTGWLLIPLGCFIRAATLFAQAVPSAAITWALAGVIYTVIYPLFIRWSIRAYAQDQGTRGVIGRITLVLTDDTLTERTESVQSVVRWQDMAGVDVVAERTYIYVTGMLAAIIPQHGFERAEDYMAVRDFAVAKLAGQAKSPKS